MAVAYAPRFRTRWILAFLTVVALGVRLWGIGSRSLNYDEVDNAYLSSRPAGDILDFHRTLVFNAPGYYVLQHYLLPLGKTETALRLPSALLGTGCVLATYALGSAVFGPEEGLLSAGLLALSLPVSLSQQARMYPLFHLLATVSFLAFYRMLSNRRRMRDVWIFTLASALSFHVHYLAVFLFAADALLFLLLAAAGPRRVAGSHLDARSAWPFAAASAGGVAVLCLPWALSAGLLSHLPTLSTPWRVFAPWKDLADTLFSFAAASFVSGDLTWQWFFTVPRLFFVTLLLTSVALAFTQRDDRLRIVLVWLGLSIGVTLGCCWAVGSYFEPRFAAFALPLWTLAIARALTSLGRSLLPAHPRGWLAATAAAVLFVSAPSLASILSAPSFGAERWRQAAELLKGRVDPQDAIILPDFAGPPVSFYLERWGLGGRARVVTSVDQVKEECAGHPASWFVVMDMPLYAPSAEARRYLLTRADWQRTIAVGGAGRLVVGHIGGRCEPPILSRSDPGYWMDFAVPFTPTRRFQLLLFLTMPKGATVRVDPFFAVEREMPGQWTDEKVRRLVSLLASGGG